MLSTSLVSKNLPRLVLALLFAAGLGLAHPAAAESRLGLGVHFWRTVDRLADDIGDDNVANIEDDGYGFVLSYQRIPRGIFRWELDLEIYADGYGGSDETAVSPIAFLLVGHGLYAGVGIGTTFSDGLSDNVSDPFYAARLGWELDLLPSLSLDINANYRAGAFNELDDFDSDAITLGAMIRFGI